MRKIDEFIGKGNSSEKQTEAERVMKENMTVLKKQLDKQKMKIITLNSKMKSLNQMEALPARKILRRSVATTQTIENFYNEEQLMTIYEKLSESKENLRNFKEKNKQLDMEKDILKNDLKHLTILKSKYQEESLDKTKIISDLQGLQALALETEKQLKARSRELEQAKQRAENLQAEYAAAMEQLTELKDLNATMHDTLMAGDADVDDSCSLTSFTAQGTVFAHAGKPAAQGDAEDARGAGHGALRRVEDRRAPEERAHPEEQQNRAARERSARKGPRGQGARRGPGRAARPARAARAGAQGPFAALPPVEPQKGAPQGGLTRNT